jgi:hypothetical protein
MNTTETMTTMKEGNLLESSREQHLSLIEKQEKEIALQHDLLKRTFADYQLLQKRVKDLENQLSRLNDDGYRNASSWVSKIVFVLQKENRPMRSVELINIFEKREPKFANHHSKAQYFSAFLNNAVKHGRIKQQKVKGVRGYYYLLPEWLDSDGNVKGSYKETMI